MEVFRFGAWEYSALLGLLKDGMPVTDVSPQQEAVLRLFLSRGREPVRDDELVLAIWGDKDKPPVDTETALRMQMTRLRKLLGNPFWIRRHRAIGFVFCAPVTVQHVDPSTAGGVGAAPEIQLIGVYNELRVADRGEHDDDTDAECRQQIEQAELALDEGQLEAARDTLGGALKLAQRIGSGELERRANCDLGCYLIRVGELEASVSLFSRLVLDARNRGAGAPLLVYLNNLGLGQSRRGMYADALSRFEEALALSKSFGDKKHQALLEAHLAITHSYASDEPAARRWAETAVQTAETNVEARHFALTTMARVCEFAGDNAEAVRWYAEAAAVLTDGSGTAMERFRAYQNLGVLILDRCKQPRYALPLLREALIRARAACSLDAQLTALHAMGTAAADANRIETAVWAYAEMLRIAPRDRWAQLRGQVGLGKVFLSAGCTEACIAWLVQASRTAIERMDSWQLAVCLCDIGVALDNAGEPAKAIPFYEKALETAARNDDGGKEAATYLGNLTRAYAVLGARPAVKLAIQAVRTVEQAHQPPEARKQIRWIARQLRRHRLGDAVLDYVNGSTVTADAAETRARRELLAAMSVIR